MATEVKGFNELLDQLNKAKESLKDTDESIKKITGRDPLEVRPIAARGRGDEGPRRIFTHALKRGLSDEGQFVPPVKRSTLTSGPVSVVTRVNKAENIHDRLGPRIRDEEVKRNVTSSVVQIAESKSRDDAIKELERTESSQVKERNRRMFGNLLGTLRTFDRVERIPVNSDALERRREVERRIEDEVEEDKETARRERKDLYESRKRKQREIEQMERKMRLVEAFNKWKTETAKLKNFVLTTGKRPIYYLPKIMTPEVEEKRVASAKIIDEKIAARQCKLEEDIAYVMMSPEEREQHRKERRAKERNTSRSRSRSNSDFGGDEEESPKKSLLSAVVVATRPSDRDKRRKDSEPVKEEPMELPELAEDQQPSLTAVGDERPQKFEDVLASSLTEQEQMQDSEQPPQQQPTETNTHVDGVGVDVDMETGNVNDSPDV